MISSVLEHKVPAMEALPPTEAIFLPKGTFVCSFVAQATRNIIHRKAADIALHKANARAADALNSISDAIICTDMSGNIDYLNIAAENLTGWTREEARGHPTTDVLQIIDGLTKQPARSQIDHGPEPDIPMGLNANMVLVRKDGSEAAIDNSVAQIHDKSGLVTGAVIVLRDITAEQAMIMKMAHLAKHDSLTNLPNRVLLKDRISQAITLAKRHGTQLAVLYLDLDNFKQINDSLGHATGDKLLQSVTQRLSASVRSSDTVSRMGGDEFVILLAECKSEQDAASSASKILAELSWPHSLAESEVHVTTSIGISLYPADGQDAETLIKNADTSMYHAKETGRSNYKFFRSDMNIRSVERQVIEANLRRAFEKQEFVLHYQPKVNLDTGLIAGAEALLRWRHGSGEWFFPSDSCRSQKTRA